MNDIERNNKTLTELIDILIRSSLDIQRVKELVNLKKELVEPTQPEGYQGLNKWYVTDKGSVYYANKLDDNDLIYGFGFSNWGGKWADSSVTKIELHPSLCFKIEIKRLATESEIKEAILKGCEQHGIVEGAVVRSMKYPHILHNVTFGTVELIGNNLCVSSTRGNVFVFDNGKFAEVVKEEKPPLELKPMKIHNEDRLLEINHAVKRCQDAGKSIPKEWEAEHQSLTAYFKATEQIKYQHTEVSNSADKELLKECLDYFNNKDPETLLKIALKDKLNNHLTHD